MSNQHTRRTFETRTIDGVDALVATDAGEIFIDLPAWNPRYIRVRHGDRIQEGDVDTKTAAEMAGPRLSHWVVDSITAETVTGTDTDTGESQEWDRELVVKRLANGTYSAELTSFDRVSVTELDEWHGRHASEGDEEVRPYVVAVAYGNSGEKFTRLYAATEAGDWATLELVQEDGQVETFDEALRNRFEDAVRTALEAERRDD